MSGRKTAASTSGAPRFGYRLGAHTTEGRAVVVGPCPTREAAEQAAAGKQGFGWAGERAVDGGYDAGYRAGYSAAVTEFVSSRDDDAEFRLGYRTALMDAEAAVRSVDTYGRTVKCQALAAISSLEESSR